MDAYDSYQHIEAPGFTTRSEPAALIDNDAFQARHPQLGVFFADEQSWAWASTRSQDFDRLAQAHAEIARHAKTQWFSRRYLLAASEAVVTLWTRTFEQSTIWEHQRASPEEIAGYLNHIHDQR